MSRILVLCTIIGGVAGVFALIEYVPRYACRVAGNLCEYSGASPSNESVIRPNISALQRILTGPDSSKFQGFRFRKASSIFGLGQRIEVVADIDGEANIIVDIVDFDGEIDAKYSNPNGGVLVGSFQRASASAQLLMYVARDSLIKRTFNVNCPVKSKKDVQIKITNLAFSEAPDPQIGFTLKHHCGYYDSGTVVSPRINGERIPVDFASTDDVIVYLTSDYRIRNATLSKIVMRERDERKALADFRRDYRQCPGKYSKSLRETYTTMEPSMLYCWMWETFPNERIQNNPYKIYRYPGVQIVNAVLVGRDDYAVLFEENCEATRDSDLYTRGVELAAGVGFDLNTDFAVTGCTTYSSRYYPNTDEENVTSYIRRSIATQNHRIQLNCENCEISVVDAKSLASDGKMIITLRTTAASLSVGDHEINVPRSADAENESRSIELRLEVVFGGGDRVQAVDLLRDG